MAQNRDDIPSFSPASRAEWRAWLEANHRTATALWLVFFKKFAGRPSVTYAEAVEEALCFGWIDSKLQPIDAKSYRQYFSVRKPNSVWSRVNKQRIEKLLAQGLMAEAGLAAIEVAKQNGSWSSLDDVEALVIPPDLQAAFDANAGAAENFAAFSRTSQRNILQWIAGAKRSETRAKRIAETATLAARNRRPQSF